MSWNFFGRTIYNSSWCRWEELAKEYIPHFMFYRDFDRNDEFDYPSLFMIDDEINNGRIGYCSYCGDSYWWTNVDRTDIYCGATDFIAAFHQDRGECPNCFRPVTFINEKKMTTYNSLTKVKRLIFSDEIDNNHINFYAVRVYNHVDDDSPEQFIEFEPASCYELSPGSVKMYRYSGDDQWVEQKSIQEPFKTFFGHGGDYEFVELGFENEFGNTFLKYSQFDDFENVGTCPEKFYGDKYFYYMTYLCMYSLYPRIEFLMKAGGYSWVYDLVYNKNKNRKYIDWSAKNYSDMFRMSKAEIKAFMSCSLSKVLLELYYNEGDGMSIIDFCKMFRCYSSEFHVQLVTLLKDYKISIDKLNRYFDTHYVMRDRVNSLFYDASFQIWRDYIEACENLGVDLDKGNLLFPKDLIAEHDKRIAQIKFSEDQKLLARAQRSLERRDLRYRFEDERFIIYLPHTCSELVFESNMQDNCVAKNYTKMHFRDETTILFLREKEKINESFYTIEIRGNVVVQKKGYHNDVYPRDEKGKEAWAYYMSRPRMEAEEFFSKWLKWVKAGSPRDTKGVPIVDKNKERKKA